MKNSTSLEKTCVEVSARELRATFILISRGNITKLLKIHHPRQFSCAKEYLINTMHTLSGFQDRVAIHNLARQDGRDVPVGS